MTPLKTSPAGKLRELSQIVAVTCEFHRRSCATEHIACTSRQSSSETSFGCMFIILLAAVNYGNAA